MMDATVGGGVGDSLGNAVVLEVMAAGVVQ